MRIKNLIIVCFLLFGIIMFSGCQRAMLYYFGVRNPKIENKESLTKACAKLKMTTDNLYCYKDSATFASYLNSGKISTPEMDFYDRNGALMLYKDNKKCVGQTDSLIDFLNPAKVVKMDGSRNIYDYLNDLRTLDGKPLSKSDFQGYDYYLVIYWAKWSGKISANHILPWEQEIKEKKDLKLKVIKVSCDYMDFWHMNKKYLVKVLKGHNKVDRKNKNQSK